MESVAESVGIISVCVGIISLWRVGNPGLRMVHETIFCNNLKRNSLLPLKLPGILPCVTAQKYLSLYHTFLFWTNIICLTEHLPFTPGPSALKNYHVISTFNVTKVKIQTGTSRSQHMICACPNLPHFLSITCNYLHSRPISWLIWYAETSKAENILNLSKWGPTP